MNSNIIGLYRGILEIISLCLDIFLVTIYGLLLEMVLLFTTCVEHTIIYGFITKIIW